MEQVQERVQIHAQADVSSRLIRKDEKKFREEKEGTKDDTQRMSCM